MKPALKKTFERAIVAVLTAGLVIALSRTSFFVNIERKTLDYRFTLRDSLRKPAPKSPIVIVGIDGEALDAYSDPIALNDALMDAVALVSAARPRVVGFDVLHLSSVDASRCKYDKTAFLATISTSRRMVIPYYLMRDDIGMPVYVADLMSNIMGLDSGEVRRFPRAAKLKLLDASEKMLPVRFGYANLTPDSDGVTREIGLAGKFGDAVLPAFALNIYLRSVGVPVAKARMSGDRLNFPGRSIPLTRGRMLINYAAPPGGYPHVSLAKVIERKNDAAYMKKMFANRVVLVGAYDLRIPDFHPTPYYSSSIGKTRSMYGVEIIANILDTIVNRRFIHAETQPVKIAFILLACFLAVFLLGRFPLWKSLPLLAALMAAFPALAQYLFSHRDFWLEITSVELALPLAFLLGHLHNTFVLERDKRFIQRVLGSYLDPRIVRSLAENNDVSLLKGRRREITVLFSDIRGFTTLSEKLQPEQVVELLNIHLSAMSRLIIQSGGMVDKYVGDAIMAVWNAPNDVDDHRELARQTALKMIAALPEVRKKIVEAGIALDAELRIGIGINTGHAIVGNIGSELKSDYTVIGDAVNVASRLESLNKQMGTVIIISESTAEGMDPKRLKDLGAVPVKGREEPVSIFELLS